jgi:glycerol-3-phosphate dehydrogenase (NAD(P)+)
MKAAVIGGGSWGSAFALYLGRLKIRTKLWVREKEILDHLVRKKENKTFLPGFQFPSSVTFYSDVKETINSSDIVFVAVPSQFCHELYKRMASYMNPEQIIVSMTKGIEEKSLLRMSQLAQNTFSSSFPIKIAVLSGPSFAKEVAQSHPTAVVIASEDIVLAKKIQCFISSPILRCYTSTDVIGVEISGAIKNVIAIAAGISDGLKYGYNTRAALITRGIAELTRLGLNLKAKMETFSGLAGLGDLVLTCTGQLSRNRQVGIELGQGKNLSSIVTKMDMIAEGITTTSSVHNLSAQMHHEMPICDQVYKVLYENKSPENALQDLMTRKLKTEFYS